jgi:hypothetical protein
MEAGKPVRLFSTDAVGEAVSAMMRQAIVGEVSS